MKFPRVSVVVYFLLLAIVLVTAVWLTWNNAHMYPGGPETQSAFFKNYSPENVLNRFNGGQGSYSHGGGHTAGYESVAHDATFQGNLPLCRQKFIPLIDALRDDVAAQLTANGATIVSQIGVAEAGFHFDYKIGKSIGSVAISPVLLVPDLGTQKNGRPDCMVDVQMRIDVAEKWFAKERNLVQVSENNSTH